MRTIKLVVDTGTPVILEAPNELTVGGLISLLNEKGITFDLQKNFLTELKSEAIFATESAMLPDGDLRLFSSIKDPKGNTERQDLYAKIKSLVERDGERAKKFFNRNENYTRVSSDNLKRDIATYERKYAGSTITKKVTIKSNTSSSKSNSTTKKKAVVNVEDDPDIKALQAKQKGFNPKLIRNR